MLDTQHRTLVRFTLGQMTLYSRLPRTGIELVKRFEGLRRKAARLESGGWVIGYGHTQTARDGAEVTAIEAEALLVYDLTKIARAVEELTFSPLNPNQFAALIAFAFNIGLENFRHSAVLKRVNEGAYLQAASALELWRKAEFDGEELVVDGLVRRRAAEKALFLSPPEGVRPVPTPVVRPALDSAAVEISAQTPGLAAPADLRVALDGEAAVAERVDRPAPAVEPEPAPSIAAEAARNVAMRLQQLYPEPEATPEPEAVPEPESPPPPEPEAPPFPPAVPTPPPVVEAAAPEPEPPPPAAPRREMALPLEDPRADQFRSRAPIAEEGASRNHLREFLRPFAGLLGLGMFIGALLTMVYGTASWLNLTMGLAGVILMIPASLQLLLRLLGERGSSRSR